MGMSRLSKQCRECQYARTCQNKWMEAVANMKQASASVAGPAVMPALAKHDYRDVKIAEDTVVTIDLEEIKENMRKSFYGGAFDVFRSTT